MRSRIRWPRVKSSRSVGQGQPVLGAAERVDRGILDMTSLRKTALVAGLCYLLTFVSVPTLVLYGPIHGVGYIVGPGPDGGALRGGLLEIVVALACIGTAVTLFPVVKRQNEALALGFVAARVLEAATIFVGVVSLFAIVTVRRASAGADPVALVAVGKSLVAIYDEAFLLGQGLIPGVNALLLGTLLYRSRLVPRMIPMIGLIGAPFFLAAKVAAILGIVDQFSVLPAVTTVPIAVWELSLGVWLVARGFTPSPVVGGTGTPGTRESRTAV
ncbi:DUF4386 domain-containing protein [Actinomycetospora endophytica]|uniref:DUF4386 domain-containing protein n=1 Tax=Actinomycetospora endophytica TaxID=2291215 RepID=A0ABS8PF96_9PSEU|nr:DUF4386 domain-containing protein [Actinomycetospora endophytica]MCD2196919.1 DUF4386 domain-containing protein [Actinomycetospora endophytica]